jgi:hypothetical protein
MFKPLFLICLSLLVSCDDTSNEADPCQVGHYEFVRSEPDFTGVAGNMAQKLLDSSKTIFLTKNTISIGGGPPQPFVRIKNLNIFRFGDSPELRATISCQFGGAMLQQHVIFTPMTSHYVKTK